MQVRQAGGAFGQPGGEVFDVPGNDAHRLRGRADSGGRVLPPQVLPAQAAEAGAAGGLGELDVVVARVPFHQPRLVVLVNAQVPAQARHVRATLVQRAAQLRGRGEVRDDPAAEAQAGVRVRVDGAPVVQEAGLV